MVEKLSENFWFIACMAVMMPIRAMIPKAIIETVRPVRNLLLRTVREASEKVSKKVIDEKLILRYPEVKESWNVSFRNISRQGAKRYYLRLPFLGLELSAFA
ncbi:MAG: hypothetical protein WDO16_22240 [Bacteroidota bacterium]